MEEIKKGDYYKLHSNDRIAFSITPDFIEIDEVYTIKGWFKEIKMCSVFKRPYLYPRLYKYSDIEKNIICKIDKEEYNKYKK